MASPVKRDLTDAQRSAVLYRLIAQKWPTDRGAYTVLLEARAGVGYDPGADGRLDAVIGANWRADGGRRLIGIEVKASRSDWLRELRDHGKRRTAEATCSELWVVAWSGVVKPEELPPDWGLLERRGSVLATVRAAVPRKVEHVPLGFALSLFRQASQSRARAGAPPWSGVHLLRFLGEDVDLETFAELIREAAAAEVTIHREAARRAEDDRRKAVKVFTLFRQLRGLLGLPSRWQLEGTEEEAEEVLQAVRLVTRGRAGPTVLRQLEHAEGLLREVRAQLTTDQETDHGRDDSDQLGRGDVEHRRGLPEGQPGLQVLLHDAGRGEEGEGRDGVPEDHVGLRPPPEAGQAAEVEGA